MLSGWKTYLCAAGIGVVALAKFLGWIDPDMSTLLETALGGGGLAALRAGVAKAAVAG